MEDGLKMVRHFILQGGVRTINLFYLQKKLKKLIRYRWTEREDIAINHAEDQHAEGSTPKHFHRMKNFVRFITMEMFL